MPDLVNGNVPAEQAVSPHVPPHSDAAEQSVIGSLFLDSEAVDYALENLKPEDFYDVRNGVIFQAVMRLRSENKPVDLTTVVDMLTQMGKLEGVGGSSRLTKISVSVPSSANVRQYVQTVRERSLYRQLIRMSRNVEEKAYAMNPSIDVLSDEVEQEVFSILQKQGSQDFVRLGDLLGDVLNTAQEIAKNGGATAGIPTGYPDLDDKLAGLHKSDLVLIGARPSMGKSALGLNIVENAAVQSGKKCAIFTLEMSKLQVANRLLASLARVNLEHMRSGTMTDDDWTRLLDAMDPLTRAEIYINDTAGITVSEVRSKCRKLQAEHGLDLVMIDYLQLMSGSGRSSGDNRQQEISEISRGLKQLAREMDVPVIALSQLSRGVENRPNKRPMMSDLRESGAIEQDADVVMFIYRDEYYNPDTDDKNVAEIIIGKQRNGPTGMVKLRYDGMYTLFSNLIGGQGYTIEQGT